MQTHVIMPCISLAVYGWGCMLQVQHIADMLPVEAPR